MHHEQVATRNSATLMRKRAPSRALADYSSSLDQLKHRSFCLFSSIVVQKFGFMRRRRERRPGSWNSSFDLPTHYTTKPHHSSLKALPKYRWPTPHIPSIKRCAHVTTSAAD